MLNGNWIANFEKELRNDKLSVDFYPLFPVPKTTMPKKISNEGSTYFFQSPSLFEHISLFWSTKHLKRVVNA